MKEMNSPEFIEKMRRGPVGFVTFLKNEPPAMGGQLFLWFVYSIIVGIFAAYVSGRALEPLENQNPKFSWDSFASKFLVMTKPALLCPHKGTSLIDC